jgi:hypothetical protein
MLELCNADPQERTTGPRASDNGKADQTMRKFQIVLLALVAMLALSAIAAGSASAETTLLA